MKNRCELFKRGATLFGAAALIGICLAATGCNLFKSKSGTDGGKAEITIWNSREQNVRIVRQDLSEGGAVVPNDQPIVLLADHIKSGLRTLECKLSPTDKAVPVFTDPEIEILGSKLSEALAQAGPDKDVTFAIIGQRKAFYDLAKQRKVTSGRVFYREKKLNIIFGKMIDDLREGIDLRVYPLTPGMRSYTQEHTWTLEETPDMQFYTGGGMVRSDWVVLDLASVVAHDALGQKPVKGVRKGADGGEAAPQYPRPQGIYLPATALPPVKAEKPIEDRLRTLDELKAKKIISDEEYKAKRINILNDL
jgi:hypothetical protein